MKIDNHFKSSLTGLEIQTKQTRGRTHWEQLPEVPKICVIWVSLSNHNCVGNRLLTLVEWARQYFPNIQFHISDILYRHNYKIQFSLSDKEATAKAENEGNAWIEYHQEIFNTYLSMTTYSFARWRKWLEHPEFVKNRDAIL